MKTYKLIKDLPRAKAGEVVIITNAHSNNPWILKINKWNEDETQRPRLAYIHTRNVDEWLEEIPEKPKSVFDLKEWDDFYFIINNIIFENIVTDCVSFKDYLKEWNIFLSKEEAEAELEKRKAIQGVRKYCYENNIELFSDEELKEILNDNLDKHHLEIIYFYHIYYHAMDKKFYSSRLNFEKHIDCFYFKKEDDVERVIKNCEEDLKIIFDV